jgi:6-phosphogluconolactonase (cycloisomerase 2 family)
MSDSSGGPAAGPIVYVGSYTPDSSGGGTGTGISTFRQDPATGALVGAGPVTPVSGPSWLAADPTGRYLYATNERPDGAVSAFAIGRDGRLTPVGPAGGRPTGGADPCHLTVDPTGRWLLVANYTSGGVTLYPIGADGAPGEGTVVTLDGTPGPDADRQDGSHTHQARFVPGTDLVLVNDLGLDGTYAFHLIGGQLTGADGAPGPAGVTHLAPGTGPRHLAFTGELVHVAGELDSTVTSYRLVDGALTGPVSTVPASGGKRGVRNYPSEIATSPDGRFGYVANRGEDTVAVFAVSADGLGPVAELPTGGEWPRHLLLVGDFLYVANQNSGTVAVFARDAATGGLTPAGTVEVPSPACLLALG